VPVDYVASDSVSVGAIRSGLDQIG
jgi:hypothetical protein